MEKLKNNLNFNYSDHRFPDVRLETCSYREYYPSQTDSFVSHGGAALLVVSDGKGVVTEEERRYTVTKGKGILITGGMTVGIKADSIEPAELIYVKIGGDSVKQLINLIEKREHGILLDFGSNGKIPDSARDMITECSKTYSSDYGIMLAFYDFINSVYEHYTEKKIPTKNIYMTRAVEYIKQNYNQNLSVESLANILGIERSYLSRLFKTYKNKSTQNYIIDYRMRQAKRMFEEEDMNVSQVCAAVGYTNIYCFSRIFKSRVGMPPKEYMERCRRHGA
ncbi:MAG: helix-turn-helix transcriptional regulator [Clostridia bacterium]|nr:helix-turn-helix transcriptional regulator [Clostridia bacterium]